MADDPYELLTIEDRIQVVEERLTNLEKSRREEAAAGLRSLETQRLETELQLAQGLATEEQLEDVDRQLREARAAEDKRNEAEEAVAELLDGLRKRAAAAARKGDG